MIFHAIILPHSLTLKFNLLEAKKNVIRVGENDNNILAIVF